MKHTYALALVALTILTIGGLQAQLVTLTDINGTVVNGTTITISEPLSADTTQTMGLGLSAQNTSGSARTINVKRYELSVPAGTYNYFCWYLCYGAVAAGTRPVWYSLDPMYLTAGQSVYGYHGYYQPNLIAGDATFRYVWYDVDSPSDSTWVDLQFTAQTAGIQEAASPVLGFDVFPNPSTGGNIAFNYALSSAASGTQLAMYNLIGERKLVRAISAVQGKVILRDGELASGIWFAVIERNGKALATKRVAVLR